MDELTGREPTDSEPSGGIEDKLAVIIAAACAARDAAGKDIDFDEIVGEIEREHPHVMLRLGLGPARKAVRLMVRTHCRRMSAMDPNDDDGPQIAIPGLERLPTHVMFPRADRKIVAKHIRLATLAQHQACLALKHMNVARCLEREAQQQRVIDLLQSTGCDTLAEWERKFGSAAA